MANVFREWTNWLGVKVAVGLVILIVLLSIGATYYFTPKYTRVGYQPTQPVPYSHALHVTQLGLDCRYCHTGVEKSGYANIPNTQTCMNCHTQILPNSESLSLVRESWKTGRPIPWTKVHVLPDYVYFNHAAHVNRGVSCVSCHGNVNHMEVVWHDKPLSMGWCLDCHRNPAKNIRPLEQVYNLDWVEPAGFRKHDAQKLVHDWHVNPPVNCSGCHR